MFQLVLWEHVAKGFGYAGETVHPWLSVLTCMRLSISHEGDDRAGGSSRGSVCSAADHPATTRPGEQQGAT